MMINVSTHISSLVQHGMYTNIKSLMGYGIYIQTATLTTPGHNASLMEHKIYITHSD